VAIDALAECFEIHDPSSCRLAFLQ
jgi:hypothetical protein